MSEKVKPEIEITDWHIAGNQLIGKIAQHHALGPREDWGKEIITSRIVKVETRNTVYVLVYKTDKREL